MNNFTTAEEISLTAVPGTPYVYLTKDANMAKCANERKTVAIENELAALPDVQALKASDMVIDVGAFIGDTALIFGKGGAKVIGFESQTDAYVAAVFNCRAYYQIHIIHAAVGNGEVVRCNEDPLGSNSGTRTIRVVHKENDKNLREYTHLVEIAVEGVRALKLDDQQIGFRVTFIKIDVEGFEPSVIQGAMQLLKRDMPTLLIEIYPMMLARHGFTADDVINPLRSLGYTRITEAIGNSTEPRWDILCKP